jgi:hypothetical protein
VVTVEDAARNNAELCQLVCGGGRFHDDAWTTPAQPAGPYPDAVTLRPGASIARILHAIEPGDGCSVKDSFADLDLAPHGFRVLFAAEWIHLPAPEPGRDPGSGFDGPELLPVGGDGWRARLNRSATCVGLSNVATAAGADVDDTWAEAIAAAAAWCPGLAIVGYERGDDLATARRHGFTSIGPLRVWIS